MYLRAIVAEDVSLPDIGPQIVCQCGAASEWPHKRWPASQIVIVAAGKIERKAKTESSALVDLGNPLQNLCAVDQIESAALVVLAEVAPIGSCRPNFPTSAHGRALSDGDKKMLTRFRLTSARTLHKPTAIIVRLQRAELLTAQAKSNAVTDTSGRASCVELWADHLQM